MLIVLSAAVIGLVIGVTAGLIAGYYGGTFDAIIMRLSDITLAFPVMVLLIAMPATLGTRILSLIVILGVTAWAAYARIVRGAVLALREREFVEAAVAMGLPTYKVIGRHVLPNCLTAILIFLTFELAGLVLVESALSFLGFGLQPPTPSWGKMVADSRGALYDAWWASAIPGAIIVLAVLAFSLLGDELRDRLDPRSLANK
jgi:peptide/nickel transport system permease protein